MLIAFVVSGFVVGAGMLALARRRSAGRRREPDWTKYLVYVLVVATVLGAASLGTRWLQVLVTLVAIAGAVELRDALAKWPQSGSGAAAWAGYTLLIVLAEVSVGRLPARTVAYLYVIVAVFDGFSQVSGQLFGRHALAPRLSPHKTIEGLAGGAVAALLAATMLRDRVAVAAWEAVPKGAVVTAIALAGGLVASWIKRRAGIKDFGRLLPGHGGVLDRFDGVLPALALGGWLYS